MNQGRKQNLWRSEPRLVISWVLIELHFEQKQILIFFYFPLFVIQVIDITSESSLRDERLHADEVTSIRQIDKTNRCFSSSLGGQIRVWRCQDPQILHLQFNSQSQILQSIYLMDFNQIVTIQQDNILGVYQMSDQTQPASTLSIQFFKRIDAF